MISINRENPEDNDEVRLTGKDIPIRMNVEDFADLATELKKFDQQIVLVSRVLFEDLAKADTLDVSFQAATVRGVFEQILDLFAKKAALYSKHNDQSKCKRALESVDRLQELRDEIEDIAESDTVPEQYLRRMKDLVLSELSLVE